MKGVWAPCGGRKNVGHRPTARTNASPDRASPWYDGSSSSVRRAWYDSAPNTWPPATNARAIDEFAATDRPDVKNVALTPAASNAASSGLAVGKDGTSTVTATRWPTRGAWLTTEPNHDALADVAPTSETEEAASTTVTAEAMAATRSRLRGARLLAWMARCRCSP